MLRQNPLTSFWFVYALFGVFTMSPPYLIAQGGAPAPTEEVTPATLNRLYTEADEAFVKKDYDDAVAKIRELLKNLGNNKEAPLELLYFNVGLGSLLAGKSSEAEAGFVEYLKRFPKGEFASRASLGVGRACILQDTPEKKARAVEALKAAALDPKYRSEAGLSLGEVLIDLGKKEEALVVFKSLMGSDIRSPQQTSAAVEVLGLLASAGKLEDLTLYLDRLSNQAGVRDAIAWYSNQVIVKGDELVGNQGYDAALAIYRSIPPRSQIVEMQRTALENQRKIVKQLESRVDAEKALPLNQRSSATDFLNTYKPAVAQSEEALKVITEKKDLDAAVLMRRGRCLYYLSRSEEALLCFRTIRLKHATSDDAKPAAFAEIILQSKLNNVNELKTLCDKYLEKYPDADNAEQVATLAGQVLVDSGKWEEVGNFYSELGTKFPKSENLDRFTFYQALASFQSGNYKESSSVFGKIITDLPNSESVEGAMYYTAISHFLSNDYKETLKSCKEYLSKFPEGRYAGDIRYRLAFIDFNDKETDQTDKIIREMSEFTTKYPADAAAGSMLCLLGDTYKRKTSDKPDELAKFEKQALDAYRKAVTTESPDEVIQYALDSATAVMQSRKDWAGIAQLHGEFLQKNPDSPQALLSAIQVAKMKSRDGKAAEAGVMLAAAIKPRVGDPTSEQVELLIDELVKTQVPKKKPAEVDLEAVDKQLVELFNKTVEGQENATTNARLSYARARLATLLRRADQADLYLKGIATINAKDPSVLSPALLTLSGDVLLKLGNLDEAEAMYQRLVAAYKDGQFSDAGPVGLGYVALARKQPAEALKIFENALTNNPGTSRFKETTLGKLQALTEVGRLDDAEKIALQIAGDKIFRGEAAGKAYNLLGMVYRKQAEKSGNADAKLELLKKAHGTYNRVYTAYKSTPDVCAEAAWQAYETLTTMGDKALADETLRNLSIDPKLKNTARAKQAAELAK